MRPNLAGRTFIGERYLEICAGEFHDLTFSIFLPTVQHSDNWKPIGDERTRAVGYEAYGCSAYAIDGRAPIRGQEGGPAGWLGVGGVREAAGRACVKNTQRHHPPRSRRRPRPRKPLKNRGRGREQRRGRTAMQSFSHRLGKRAGLGRDFQNQSRVGGRGENVLGRERHRCGHGVVEIAARQQQIAAAPGLSEVAEILRPCQFPSNRTEPVWFVPLKKP